MTNYCKENTGMVIHTDSFANERRFVCILKCRRTRQTRVVSGWMLLRCLKGNCLRVTDMWANHLLGPPVMDATAGALSRSFRYTLSLPHEVDGHAAVDSIL